MDAGADLLRQINPLTADRGYSGVECAAAALEIDDGLATTPRGLITRETAYYDQLTAMVQLGALPDLSSTRGKLWLLCTYPLALIRMIRARFY